MCVGWGRLKYYFQSNTFILPAGTAIVYSMTTGLVNLKKGESMGESICAYLDFRIGYSTADIQAESVC